MTQTDSPAPKAVPKWTWSERCDECQGTEPKPWPIYVVWMQGAQRCVKCLRVVDLNATGANPVPMSWGSAPQGEVK